MDNLYLCSVGTWPGLFEFSSNTIPSFGANTYKFYLIGCSVNACQWIEFNIKVFCLCRPQSNEMNSNLIPWCVGKVTPLQGIFTHLGDIFWFVLSSETLCNQHVPVLCDTTWSRILSFLSLLQFSIVWGDPH